ncbi:hypothetical protein F5Y18DRAFT_59273 [Xylariaceae sp. FL1019]|nr:hypothetical protein F5Y18DRAFT_59273 [Xylariaceae sp. FL1019]
MSAEPQDSRASTGSLDNNNGALLTKRSPSQPEGPVLTDGSLYPNGYHFPPAYPVKEQIQLWLVSFWDFYNTGFGFFLTIYGLLVVGWGGMLFLLLVNAAPEMCWSPKPGAAGEKYFNCNDINAPRRIWIEIGSQILNALFSVTGFGLAPWRLRDLYLLLRYRLRKDRKALRRIAGVGVHRGWLRLPGSDMLPPTLGPKTIEETTVPYDVDTVPYPLETIPDSPPTGVRAPPTKLWKLDFIVWLNVWNTIFQGFLAGFMWALNRYDRPSWTTGLFVALALIASSAAGIMQAIQQNNVKKVEGVPLTKKDHERLLRDRQMGILHYNNLKDKDPAVKKKEKGRFRRHKEAAESAV